MKAIYASKLYRASNRKDKIQSALEDPKNQELVKQLARYLDDEYVPTAVRDLPDARLEGEQSHPSSSHGGPRPAPSHPSGGGYSSGGLGDMADIELPGGEDDIEPGDSSEGADSSESTVSETIDDIDNTDDVDDAQDNPDEPEAIQESTEVTKQSVTASTNVELSSLPEEVKGTLNSRQDCCGVNRVMIKDNELWIHYNDDINLNNVMTSVIELFNAIGYTYLEFNRLARSANAIVFLVNINDTANCVKPVEEINDQNNN